jgi:nucleoside-diphosphate-sugar epimerase
MFNRGKRDSSIDARVKTITGDRNDAAALAQCTAGGRTWDAVIDMIAYTTEHAETAIRTFAGKCDHFLFCSTVCTYGVKIPPGVIVDETFPQDPISAYGRNKVACEKLVMAAHERGDFKATIVRPSTTYGEGAPLIDQLEPNACAWDRIEKGLPVFCTGDGLGLCNTTHRDDCGAFFAYACGNEKTFGESYNAAIERLFTWRDFYREAAAALGKTAKLILAPAEWVVAHDPQRFGLLREITQFHGPFTSAKARRDVPQFDPKISFTDGARRTLQDLKRQGKWRDGASDTLYQQMVDKALAVGFPVVEA